MDNKLLIKLRKAVANRQSSGSIVKLGSKAGPKIQDVRSGVMGLKSYKWVLIITALVAIYYVFFASDRYVASTELYIKSTQATPVSSLTQLGLMGVGASADSKDGHLLTAYFKSRGFMEKLENDLHIFEHFSSKDADFFSRLPLDATTESKLEYLRQHMNVSVDPETGLIKVSTQSFTPEFSYKILLASIKYGEAFINEVGQRLAREETKFVEQELSRAKENLKTVSAKILEFQNEHGLLDAEAAGVNLQSVVGSLENDIVRLQTEEKTLSTYLNDSASELVTVRGKIKAVQQQLAQERAKMASGDQSSINDIYLEYKALQMELQFATDLYTATVTSLERTRVDSYHNLKHVVVVQEPGIPEVAEYPRKLYNIFTVFVCLSLAYGIITMIIATIREHRDV